MEQVVETVTEVSRGSRAKVAEMAVDQTDSGFELRLVTRKKKLLVEMKTTTTIEVEGRKYSSESSIAVPAAEWWEAVNGLANEVLAAVARKEAEDGTIPGGQ